MSNDKTKDKASMCDPMQIQSRQVSSFPPVVPQLTDDQRLELARCFALYFGCDPQDKDDWRSEMVSAKKYVRDALKFWGKIP
jgi:hypothetical protein